MKKQQSVTRLSSKQKSTNYEENTKKKSPVQEWVLAPSKDFTKMDVGETCMCNGRRVYISKKSITVDFDRRFSQAPFRLRFDRRRKLG